MTESVETLTAMLQEFRARTKTLCGKEILSVNITVYEDGCCELAAYLGSGKDRDVCSHTCEDAHELCAILRGERAADWILFCDNDQSDFSLNPDAIAKIEKFKGRARAFLDLRLAGLSPGAALDVLAKEFTDADVRRIAADHFDDVRSERLADDPSDGADPDHFHCALSAAVEELRDALQRMLRDRN